MAAGCWEKQQQAQQDGAADAIVKPGAPGRKLCVHGVYQGLIGKSPKRGGSIPLVSALFALDRGKWPLAGGIVLVRQPT